MSLPGESAQGLIRVVMHQIGRADAADEYFRPCLSGA
jgi:hypothetical protein